MLHQVILSAFLFGATPTYADDIEPLVRKHCITCHQEDEAGPMELTDYNSVRKWAGMMREVISVGRMPPWGANPRVGDFVNARVVSDAEKQLFSDWIAADKPSGDLSKVKPFVPVKWDWHRPDPPDVVLEMPEPFNVPATGVVDYQYITLDPHFDHDVWVSDVELAPSNRKVVHHAAVLIEPPANTNLPSSGFSDVLAGYLPGAQFSRPAIAQGPLWGFRTGVIVPAGSKIKFQMHYAPIGAPQSDQAKVGLWICDASKVDRVAVATNILAMDMVIPPRSEHTEISRYTPPFEKETPVYALNGHMHLRGKSFQLIAHYPDNTTEVLLDVPHYNFDWQDTYLLREPKVLPVGTRVEGVAVFDNSEMNKRNPDPSKEVRWGEQTEDEMWFGGLISFVPKEEYLEARRSAAPAKIVAPVGK